MSAIVFLTVIKNYLLMRLSAFLVALIVAAEDFVGFGVEETLSILPGLINAARSPARLSIFAVLPLAKPLIR
jgi:hypothetical protein